MQATEDRYLINLNDPLVEKLIFVLKEQKGEDVRRAVKRLKVLVDLYVERGDEKQFQLVPNIRL